ncbi:MAG: T9SS type A sorting domain-containing protein [bacterium]
MKLALLTSFAFLFSMQIFGQDFAPIGAKWYYDELAGMFWSPYDVDYILYTSEKDTTINGQNCRKIIKRHDLDCYFRPKNEFVFSRQDSVFYYDAIIDTFQLLYNFNASEGDDWSFIYKDYSNPGYDTVNVHVDSVGSLNANEQVLRLLYVTYAARRFWGISQYQSIIVEKMGDLFFMFNFFPSSSMVCDGNLSRGLRCYEDSNIGSYHFPSMESCTYTHLWTEVKSNKVNEILIYPNPISESIYISGIIQLTYFKIFDIKGMLIKSGTITNSEIKTNELIKGVYFLKLSDSEGKQVYYKKIIKY